MFIKIWKYKFHLIPTLFTVPTFILLITLGCWQLDRLTVKKEHIHRLQERANLPTIQLPQALDDIHHFKYRKVRLQGEYIHDKEIFLYSGSRSNESSDGFMLFTPFKTTDDRIILVNRGWVPTDLKSQANRLDTLEPGLIEVTGYIMPEEQASWVIPENDDKRNIWFYINLAHMGRFARAKVGNFYIMKSYDGNQYPIGNNLNINLRNHHLEYAITWFTLAFTLIAIFILYHKKINTDSESA